MCSSAVRISRFLFEWFAVGLLFADHCFEGLGLYSSEMKPEVSGQRAVCGFRSSDERREIRQKTFERPSTQDCVHGAVRASGQSDHKGLGFRV